MEQVGHAVKEDESLSSSRGRLHLVVSETHADENDGQNGETHQLELLSSPLVNDEEGEVVSGDETTDGENDVSDGDIVEGLVVVDVLVGTLGVGTETNGGEDDRRVETETVESDIKGKPRPGCTEEDFTVLPLTKVSSEVGPGGLGELGPLVVLNGVDDVGSGGEVSVDILGSLLDVSLDIHGVSRSLRDGQSEVEGDGGRDHSESNDESPHLVNRLQAVGGLLDSALESDKNDNGDNGRGD